MSKRKTTAFVEITSSSSKRRASPTRAGGRKSPSPDAKYLPSSSAPSNPAVILPAELVMTQLETIAHGLLSIGALGTLSSLSRTNKAINEVTIPILYESITLRSHRQLAAVLSSLNFRTSTRKRRTRVSGTTLSVKQKLETFRHTKGLSINHFPSLENLAKLSSIQTHFEDTPVFPEVHTLHLSPLLAHRLHPGAFDKPSVRPTEKRLKDIHLFRILATPSHLELDLRGTDEDWTKHPSADSTAGCMCAHDFIGELGKAWMAVRKLKELTVYLDPTILSTHFFTSAATGPSLRIIITPTTEWARSNDRPPAKRTRRSTSTSVAISSGRTLIVALATFVLHRARKMSEYRGGGTRLIIMPGNGGEDEEMDAGLKRVQMIEEAKAMAGGEEDGLFEGVKARKALKSIEVEVAEASIE